MREALSSYTERNVCWMYFGLYVFLASITAPTWLQLGWNEIFSLLDGFVETLQPLVQGKLPSLGSRVVQMWGKCILLGFGAFLFVHYYYRLRRHAGALPGRSLWVCTMIHLLGVLAGLLPSGFWTIFGGIWFAYFVMAVMALRAVGNDELGTNS